ncbi:hypothetical protein [Marinimicrobium sp. ARAG 43.8]|uniref:hypothetical protein n=1 Tax=Marinimicrobium sp. ARAG 43.8 TaxID=3418719 RepID=UPI003CF41658
MTVRFIVALSLCLTTMPPLLAQIDIYQSDAYSAEEVCARDAEQASTNDYNESYETCLNRQRDHLQDQNRETTNGKSTEDTDQAEEDKL